VTSARKCAANRRNAQASTGPRTAAGKARVAHNARRHGLNVAIADDPALAQEAEELAQAICGSLLPPLPALGGERVGVRGLTACSEPVERPLIPTFSPQAGRRRRGGAAAGFDGPPVEAHLLFFARRIAEAQVDVMRVRRARRDMIALALANPDYRSTRNIRGRIALLAAAGKLIRHGLPVPPEMRDAIMVRPTGPAKFALILADLATQLGVMARYERRALSRRNTAVRAFDEARAGSGVGESSSAGILIALPALGAEAAPQRSAATLRRWRNKAKILREGRPAAPKRSAVPPPPWGATPIDQIPRRQVVNYICRLLKMEPAYPSELPRDGPQMEGREA
jgi:hypothetical protein